MYIMPLGGCCAITFLLQNLKLKKETSLFEWFKSTSLKSITEVVRKLEIGEEINIFQKEHQVAILDRTIYSGHYNLVEYKDIFKRRSTRFIEQLKNNNEILFIRFQRGIEYDKCNINDINNFLKIIKEINPKISCKFLLIEDIDDINNFIPLIGDSIINKPIDKKISDTYVTSIEINSLFKKILLEIGVDFTDTYNMVLTDKD